ncbi:type II toxin-antitoxin system RelE/ParE family toxin [Methylobacterium aquaticum]|uniref:type II toxin-antitoxin system RelE/ParE family toxin n=1 Tax=Methylobacterium aquaticum TaxID=270351 RepID=UPI001933774C|nr:type II toxin-antitoxin system RelE/ParE family toxin [Methylobacterium aquaticum]QRE76130.1 addiction module toxin RelE [Methylobacterium aquaticum]
MSKPLHTVVETPNYLADAKRAGMTEVERQRSVNTYAKTPDYGDEIQGSGGFRKGRVAGRGKGKSGGYRVVSIYLDETIPVFLVAVLSKGDRENFTDAEVAEFKKVATAIKSARRRSKER